ncbi:hypothetical protein FCX55_21700 [Escherichia coli]|nr:hypothetical protein [Escherichia coli]
MSGGRDGSESGLRFQGKGISACSPAVFQVCVSRRVCTGLTKFNRDKIVVSVQPEPSGQNLTN